MASIGLIASDTAVDAAIQPISAYNINLHFRGTAAGKGRKRRKKNVALHRLWMNNLTKVFGREEKKTFSCPRGRKIK